MYKNVWLMLSLFFGFLCTNCSEFTPLPSQADETSPITLRSDIAVYPAPDTSVDEVQLAERGGYATTFTDPYGYLWTMTSAEHLSDQDFAMVGVFLASKTDNGHDFYYGKVRTWEIQPDCVVYLAATDSDFLSLRRNQDQGPCPTSAGYAAWLPQVERVNLSAPLTQPEVWAYGANNHQDNLVHGSFQGIEAYGNDPYGWHCTDFHLLSDCLAYAGIHLTGAKWDSAEFVSRFFITQYDHSPMWEGPAKYWYEEARNYGLKRFHNCGSVRPAVGDMLVSNGGSHGHAAIIRAVTDHSVTVIQQNWFESENDNNLTLIMSTAGSQYCVARFGSGYEVQGWLRP